MYVLEGRRKLVVHHVLGRRRELLVALDDLHMHAHVCARTAKKKTTLC